MLDIILTNILNFAISLSQKHCLPNQSKKKKNSPPPTKKLNSCLREIHNSKLVRPLVLKSGSDQGAAASSSRPGRPTVISSNLSLTVPVPKQGICIYSTPGTFLSHEQCSSTGLGAAEMKNDPMRLLICRKNRKGNRKDRQ